MVSLCWYLWDIASAVTGHHPSIQLEPAKRWSRALLQLWLEVHLGQGQMINGDTVYIK